MVLDKIRDVCLLFGNKIIKFILFSRDYKKLISQDNDSLRNIFISKENNLFIFVMHTHFREKDVRNSSWM